MQLCLQEEPCCICYGDMHLPGGASGGPSLGRRTDLVWCRQGCGHNMHCRCLQVNKSDVVWAPVVGCLLWKWRRMECCSRGHLSMTTYHGDVNVVLCEHQSLAA